MEDFAPTALFAYGTLALPDVVDALTGRVPAARPARLAGYRCRLIRNQDDAGIEYRQSNRHIEQAPTGTLNRHVEQDPTSTLNKLQQTC